MAVDRPTPNAEGASTRFAIGRAALAFEQTMTRSAPIGRPHIRYSGPPGTHRIREAHWGRGARVRYGHGDT